MPLTLRSVATLALLAGLSAPPILAAAAADPLLALLSDDDFESARAAIRDRVSALGGSACRTLSAYATAPVARAREHAVRALADARCAGFEDYRPFLGDRDAWVVEALEEALARARLDQGVPFLLARLGDRRRLVSDTVDTTLEAEAHRALRRLTAQPIPFDPRTPPPVRDVAAAAWRTWYGMHLSDPPGAWIDTGLREIAAALRSDDPNRRLAALETLSVLGEEGARPLAEALSRAAGEVAIEVACTPVEPPRMADRVPCALTLRNLSARRMALAPGEVRVALEAAPAAAMPAPRPARDGAARPAGASRDGGSFGDRARPARPAAPDAAILYGRFVDLAPGETLSRSFEAGPVTAAGHYVVRATLDDLAAGMREPRGGAEPGPWEAVTNLRFEP